MKELVLPSEQKEFFLRCMNKHNEDKHTENVVCVPNRMQRQDVLLRHNDESEKKA